MDVSRTILKNGIKEMFSENNESFKENIQQVLAIKLNESITNVNREVSRQLLDNNTTTANSEELNYFLEFITNFKPGKHSFKDGSIINITESEKENIKNLFETLNTKNRELMIKQIFESGILFKEHIEFAKQSRNLQ